MIQLSVPIYYKDYNPRATKNYLMGLNWYAKACNVHNGSSVASRTKKVFGEMVERYAPQIKAQLPKGFDKHTSGYHVHYDIYLGRDGSDGHNVRSLIEKFLLDALEDNGLIDNDRYVWSTSTKVYLDRKNPRADVVVTKLDSHEYEVT